MNRNLVYFSFFLVLIGVGFGFYLLSFLGLLLLIPALLSPSRLPAPRPQQPRQPPRRIIPQAPQPQPSASMESATPTAYASASVAYSSQQMQPSSALFPTTMFPSLSQMGTSPAEPSQPPAKNEPKDDLVEVGTILVLLKLVFG